jgi:tryptophan halogenase
MSIPDTLQRKMDRYRSNGRIFRENNELFAELSWLQVMQGQGLHPRGYHPLADLPSTQDVLGFVEDVERVIGKCVDVMPTQAEYIAANCAAGKV